MGEPILRQPCRPVGEAEFRTASLRHLITDLVDTMRAQNGVGIAAPQIFQPQCVCVIEVERNPRYPRFPRLPLTVLVNPRLTPIVQSHDALASSDGIATYEGCLSVPGIRGRVTRPRKVRIQAQDPEGTAIDLVWEGAAAVIVQHEVDHLRGRLFVDLVEPDTLTFLDEYQQHVPPEQRLVDGGAEH